MSEEQGRGQLTKRIKAKSLELLGYEMDQTELRLMPYIMYVMVNEQKVSIRRSNAGERKILQRWRDNGYIESPASGMKITEEFWNIICEIVRLGYVDLD